MVADFDDRIPAGVKKSLRELLTHSALSFPTLQSYDGNPRSAKVLIEEQHLVFFFSYGAIRIAAPLSIRSSLTERIVLIERKQRLCLLVA